MYTIILTSRLILVNIGQLHHLCGKRKAASYCQRLYNCSVIIPCEMICNYTNVDGGCVLLCMLCDNSPVRIVQQLHSRNYHCFPYIPVYLTTTERAISYLCIIGYIFVYFSDPGACLENVEYLPDRNLKREELLRFGTCKYIQEHHNIILQGATGSDKTHLACALGMAAVRQFLTVKYIRLPDLLVEFHIARGDGSIRKLLTQYKKYSLLIIDEWLLYPLKKTEARDLPEVMEARYKRASTILCSQFYIPGWEEKLYAPILADAICDRIVHDAYTLSLAARSPCGSGKDCR